MPTVQLAFYIIKYKRYLLKITSVQMRSVLWRQAQDPVAVCGDQVRTRMGHEYNSRDICR